MTLARKHLIVIAAAGLIYALVFGARQSLSLFIGPLNTATGLGLAAISLAFAWAQLMWGVTQPIAGAMADKFGAARVIAVGASFVCNVESTKCPVSAACTAISAVGRSRISPTMMMSGSCRINVRTPLSKSTPICGCTCI